MKTLIATRLSDRVSQLGYFSALQATLPAFDELPLLATAGDHYTGDPHAMGLLLQWLEKHLFVTHRARTKDEAPGFARDMLRLFDGVRFCKSMHAHISLLNIDYVLFLDDDALLNIDFVHAFQSSVTENTGMVAIQHQMLNNLGRFSGIPSFDPFCSVVPIHFVLELFRDMEFLDFYLHIPGSFEFFALDWWFRKHGLMFNVFDRGVLHLHKDASANRAENQPDMSEFYLQSFAIKSVKGLEKAMHKFLEVSCG